VEISVYDIAGKEVMTIANEKLQHGNHAFNIDTNKLSAGTYVVGLVTDTDVETTKIIITK